ncbi:MAG: diguanylate cyclase [Acidobacteria bacterium]|nr:diguanylate cyclase [Acidobacteriota bacterium]
MSGGSEGGPGAVVRREAIEVLRERNAALVSDLSSELHALYADALTPESSRSAATLLLTLTLSALEHGEVSPRAGAVHDLYRICLEALGPRRLFHATETAGRIIADELALDDRIGATSEPWPMVLLFVRRAALDVLAAFTARLLDTPAYGAVRDPLTTLIARPVFDLALEQETQRAMRHQGSFALILFDVDDLSAINREHGYGVGDRVLERLGILARRFFRTHDWIARHDEDSIVALLPETSLDQAALLATRFRDTVRQRLVLVDHKSESRASVTLTAAAVAVERVQAAGLEAAAVMREAETAVARAKLEGRNRTERIALMPTSVTLLAAATLLECTLRELRRMIRSGALKATRRGRHYLVDRADIARLQAQ